MNSKKSLKSTNFIFFLGLALILIGLFSIYSNKNKVIQILPSATPLTSISSATFAKVTRVIDGDTIVIDTGEHVRYIGMNTPELESNECYASEAADINRDMVLGKQVKLVKDVSETDKYGRLLRYVYIDDGSGGDEMINNELTEIGLAKVETVPPDIKYKNEFLQAESFAKENKLGLWGRCPE